jgi:mercuric ion transport protein
MESRVRLSRFGYAAAAWLFVVAILIQVFLRLGYAAAAWLFVVAILIQVFLIGLTLLGGRPTMNTHRGLGHMWGILVLLLIMLAYMGRLPRPMKPLTWLSVAIYVLLADIVIFMRGSAPLLAALHPVLAMVLFGIVGFLAVRAWRLVREPANIAATSRSAIEATGD